MSGMIRRLWESPPSARGRYYLDQSGSLLWPRSQYVARGKAWFAALRNCQDPSVFDRAAYYHQLQAPFVLASDLEPFCLNLTKKRSTYQLDLYSVLRYFPGRMRLHAIFGDVRDVPNVPAIVKSRPIGVPNAESVLLNLNKVRHFYFVRDPYRFRDKREVLVWRGRACQQHRKDFLARYHDHPLCDAGHYHPRHQDVPWVKPKLSVLEQLRCKYVLAIEGNDVATNLKWVMASNSLCFMAKPRYETWFMEGRLVEGQHYVGLRDDYADLEEKICYYNRHEAEAESMIREANAWVAGFQDHARERMIGILVLWHYLYLSGQMAEPPPSLGA